MVKSISSAMHPNACLNHIRNTKAGLITRSKILQALDEKSSTASGIAKQAVLSYSVVLHHLRLLQNEGLVNRKGERPSLWMPTGLGQKRLIT